MHERAKTADALADALLQGFLLWLLAPFYRFSIKWSGARELVAAQLHPMHSSFVLRQGAWQVFYWVPAVVCGASMLDHRY